MTERLEGFLHGLRIRRARERWLWQFVHRIDNGSDPAAVAANPDERRHAAAMLVRIHA